MAPLRGLICNNSSECFFSHYADRPGCLFIGVHQKLTICLLVKSSKGSRSIYTSRYNHWSKGSAPHLFSSVKPYRIDIEHPNRIIPKIGSDIEKDILSRVCADETKNILDATADNGRYSVWLNMRMCFWAKAFCHEQNSREYKRFDFDNQQMAKAFAAFFNSSLFFFIWEAISDCWHITSREFSLLNFSLKDIPQPILDSLCTVYDSLEAELERTKKHIGSVQTEFIYQHKFHKHHIDKIDDLLGEYFGFSEAGLEYIKRYQETYRLNTASRKKMNVIDLFSGVGGLSLGFENVGFNIILANEIDPEIARSYRLNHPDTVMLNCDIKEFADDSDECIRRHSGTTAGSTFRAVTKQLNSVDVVIGGPPCQGFSMAGGRIRKAKAFFEDPRNNLFHQYFRIIQKYEPRYFVFENVVGLLSSKKGEIIKTIKSLFSDSANFKNGGYHLNIKILDASDFGVPQTRRRVFIIGSKTEFDIDKAIRDTLASFDDELRARFTQKTTVRDAIYDLVSHVDEDGFPNHNATAHSAKAKMRMQKIRPNQNFTSLDEEIKSIHSGSYGRLDWDKPATTITTRFDTPSAGRYIHPDADRTITPREAARIQSFPDSFVFYGSKSSVCKQIGNAVPPRMAEFIARLITYIDTNQTKC